MIAIFRKACLDRFAKQHRFENMLVKHRLATVPDMGAERRSGRARPTDKKVAGIDKEFVLNLAVKPIQGVPKRC